jgi:predicted glycoside hydrolase/deacetylase ChbG (UPF0249 family)
MTRRDAASDGESADRVLSLCADDFGHSPGVSDAIAALARAGRLNAVSCLTNLPHWRAGAEALQDLPAGVDVGLHFNLTEGAPASPELRERWPRLPSLPALLARAFVHALPHEAIAAEFAAQYRAFVEGTGREPAFIDGHQHVHHLPGVREIVLDGVAGAARPTAVRSTARVLGPGFAFKRAVIAGTGGRALARALAARGIAHNQALIGVYDFQPGRYRARMQAWLAAMPAHGALLFCHPGWRDERGAIDAIGPARREEAEYLASEAFADDLRAARVRLGAAWQRVSDATREMSTRG